MVMGVPHPAEKIEEIQNGAGEFLKVGEVGIKHIYKNKEFYSQGYLWQ